MAYSTTYPQGTQPLPAGTEPAPGYTGPLPGYQDHWWDRAIGWLGRKLGLNNVADESVFWPAAYMGQIMCPGPFTYSQVYELLRRASPEQIERARQSIYARSWYRKFPPQDLAQLAGALVAEAHGGRDCTAADRESLAAASAIRQLATSAPAPGTGPGGFVPGLGEDIPPTQAGIGLLLALGVGAYFFLKD